MHFLVDERGQCVVRPRSKMELNDALSSIKELKDTPLDTEVIVW